MSRKKVFLKREPVTALLEHEEHMKLGRLALQQDISKAAYLRRLVQYAIREHLVLPLILVMVLVYGICSFSGEVRILRTRGRRREDRMVEVMPV